MAWLANTFDHMTWFLEEKSSTPWLLTTLVMPFPVIADTIRGLAKSVVQNSSYWISITKKHLLRFPTDHVHLSHLHQFVMLSNVQIFTLHGGCNGLEGSNQVPCLSGHIWQEACHSQSQFCVSQSPLSTPQNLRTFPFLYPLASTALVVPCIFVYNIKLNTLIKRK